MTKENGKWHGQESANVLIRVAMLRKGSSRSEANRGKSAENFGVDFVTVRRLTK